MSLRNSSYSLVIPAFNEQNRLLSPLDHLFSYLDATFNGAEAIYVDDGSTDRTYDLLLDAQQRYPWLRVLHYEKNRGKGYALRRGLQAASGDIVIFSDADLSTPIEETEKLLDTLNKGYDVVIGSRGLSGSRVELPQSWIRETAGKLGNYVIRAMLPLSFLDTQCGFKMFRKEALQLILPRLTIDGFAFDVELLTIAHFLGLRIAEIPVVWRNAPESKVRALHNLQVLRDLFRIRYQLAMNRYA